MGLSHYPGIRVFGEEPDEVEVEVRVAGKRVREAVIALAKVTGNGEVIPISIGIPGLDRITGGMLIGTEVNAERLGEHMTISFTIRATNEIKPGEECR